MTNGKRLLQIDLVFAMGYFIGFLCVLSNRHYR